MPTPFTGCGNSPNTWAGSRSSSDTIIFSRKISSTFVARTTSAWWRSWCTKFARTACTSFRRGFMPDASPSLARHRAAHVIHATAGIDLVPLLRAVRSRAGPQQPRPPAKGHALAAPRDPGVPGIVVSLDHQRVPTTAQPGRRRLQQLGPVLVGGGGPAE